MMIKFIIDHRRYTHIINTTKTRKGRVTAHDKMVTKL